MGDDKINITIELCGEKYPIKVAPKQEVYYRKAAKWFDENIKRLKFERPTQKPNGDAYDNFDYLANISIVFMANSLYQEDAEKNALDEMYNKLRESNIKIKEILENK